ncbi:hypothetical protein [Vibrio campbellii]|uniref:Uncharacterized protein n=1 Tax=Vibrio campbellii (strain ATCC BAA-1116) TaxID=2902295 RepID=A7N8W9_VIBC1|nr:hypothetical protein [Vibrio campbellii]ABU75030.1 hypothetical protein VIBHAR_p08183 [Vibrio campbellii ATCC BAA-1116]AGU99042.1 hypothetical protein M892_28355 [Vibrio campbellii ATCC BAA-1116]MBT0124651.1 hypothetical protein [Vibrio campbellii]MBT0139575.1 hypothetical protein [Vibrio campbellii]MBT0144254.1 hypothetical protein [Vibrio campbellii]
MKTKWFLLLWFFSVPAFCADSIHCKGTVTDAWIQSDGSLIINTSWASFVGLCSVSKTKNGITPDTCKSWVSMALTAVTTQKPLMMQYYNLKKCSDIKRYTASEKPHYVMIRESLD